ncbi:alpha/beta hydrolase family esterase [Oxalobacteraceae bacterium A2-2]
MKIPLLKTMREAAQQLLSRGPVAATAAIQENLGKRAKAAPPAPGPAMRDINPPPQAAQQPLSPATPPPATPPAAPRPAAPPQPAPERQGPAPSGPQARTETAAAAPHPTDMAQDMLNRMGININLQASMEAALPPGLRPGPNGIPAGFELPRFDFSGLDLPGMQNPATPPAPLPEGAQFISGSYVNHAGSRAYKLYIPSSYHGQAMPLLVMLHGCTQDPDDFAAGTRMNQIAEEQQYFVVYPEQNRQANHSKCWNWFNEIDQTRGQGEPSIIAGIAQQVIDEYPVNERQVYVAGLSAGGAMAVIVGTLYPDIFAAVGVHSGLPFASAKDLPSALGAMKRGAAHAQQPAGKALPIIVFHGDQDSTVHPLNGEQVMEQGLGRHGGKARPSVSSGAVPDGYQYTRTTHRHPDGSTLGEHWVVHGAGHAWSGGSASGSYTDGKGPDASREMLRFFSTLR